MFVIKKSTGSYFADGLHSGDWTQTLKYAQRYKEMDRVVLMLQRLAAIPGDQDSSGQYYEIVKVEEE